MNKIEKIIEEMCSEGIKYKKLSDLIIKNPKSKIGAKKAEKMEKGKIPFFTSGKTTYYIKECLIDGENLFVNDGGKADIKYYNGKAHYADHVISFKATKINGRYLFHYLTKERDYINKTMFRGTGIKNINKNDFFSMLIPVPPMEVQNQIVDILDNFSLLSAEISEKLSIELKSRQKQYEYYINKLLKSYDEMDNTYLKNITTYSKERISASELSDENYIGVDNLLQNKMGKTISTHIPKEGNSTKYSKSDILIGNIRPYLKKIWLADREGGASGDVLVIHITSSKVIPEYLYYILSSNKFFDYDNNNAKGGKMPRGNKEAVMNYRFYLPSIEEQTKIVNILKNFELLCNNLLEELLNEIEARQKQYMYYMDKILSFKEH